MYNETIHPIPCYYRLAHALQSVLAHIPASLAPPGYKAMAAHAAAWPHGACGTCPQCIDAALPQCNFNREHMWQKCWGGKPDFCKHCGLERIRNISVPHAATPINKGPEYTGQKLYVRVQPGNAHATCMHDMGWALSHSKRVPGWWDHACVKCWVTYTLPDTCFTMRNVADLVKHGVQVELVQG